MGRSVEISKEEADEILAASRHSDLVKQFGLILSALNKEEQKDTTVADAIKEQTKTIERFVEAIKAVPKPEKPEISVSVSNEALQNCIEKAGENIVKSISELKDLLYVFSQQKTWEFTVNRNAYTGILNSITATSKIKQLKN